MQRLDLQHNMFLLTIDNKLGLSPPNQPGAAPAHVLDLGTGTGIWVLEFCEEHPESSIIGIDLSPIQPTFIPPNVQFQIDDIEAEWTFSHKFDYIHSRAMNLSIKNWPAYIKQCYDNLKPGGFLELQEFGLVVSADGTLTSDTALGQAMDIMIEGAKLAGRPFIDPWKLRPWLEEAGFVDIVEERFFWPTNSWPKDAHLKELGAWSNINLREGMEGFILAYATRMLGWDPKEVAVLAAKARNDVNNRAIHGFDPVVFIYGRKPE